MSFFDEFGKYGSKIAFQDDRGQRITYSEMVEWTDHLSAFMEPRSLCFCLCENSVGSALGYVTCLRRKVVPLLIDRKIDSSLLEQLMQLYHPRYIYVPTEMVDRFPDYSVKNSDLDYSLIESNVTVELELFEDLALLLTTSGSTGSPKLVRQTYKNIQSNAVSIVQYLELDETERPITTLPMHYTYGLSIINSHLLVGATILMTDKAMVNKQFWDYMKVEKATSFGGVPFTYELLKKIRFFKMDLPDLRYLTQAGGKLPTNLHQEFATWAAENGKKFVVMYGQTEATARMAYLPAEESLRKCGSMGKVIPGGTFILVGVDGKEITEPNQVGELVYEGDNVTLGYAECSEDLAKGDERGGRLETGDMARIDEEGFYYIVGRKKRFLKIFGNRVNLDEIDQLIKVNFEGLDCASTGVDDHMKTFITDENQVVPVRQFLSRITHLSESAFEVHAIAEIPKNEAGKTLYKDLPV